MKFKHTFHVFVDNFSVIYKQLLYRLVVLTVMTVIGSVCVYQFIGELINSAELNSLIGGVRDFVSNFLNGNVSVLSDISENVKKAFELVIEMLRTKMVRIVLGALFAVIFIIIGKWFTGLGNYSTAILINDKMALRAKSPFLGSLISNLKSAALYNLIYAPLCVLYDLLVAAALAILLYFLIVSNVIPIIIGIFIFVLVFVIAVAFKMTFTCDWLPSLIRGKLSQKDAIVYTFSRKNKQTLNVFSNFIVLIIIIMSVNVTAVLTTFGVGLLLTIPASFVILECYEMVNYFDREELKYFIDKTTIVKPGKEAVVTREQFFRGEDNQ